jgi:hypothetical protein
MSVFAQSVLVVGVDVSWEVSMAMSGLDVPDDHDLLLGGVVASIEANRAAADQWARLVEFFRRREADDSTDIPTVRTSR